MFTLVNEILTMPPACHYSIPYYYWRNARCHSNKLYCIYMLKLIFMHIIKFRLLSEILTSPVFIIVVQIHQPTDIIA